MCLDWGGSIEAQFWESPFREDSGLPTLTLAFTLTTHFHSFSTHVFYSLCSHFLCSHFLFTSTHFTPFTPITRPTTSHSPHSLLLLLLLVLLLLCYGAHLVFSSGTVSSRSTRRAEHAPSGALHGSCAEALWKLSSSTATQHAAETST